VISGSRGLGRVVLGGLGRVDLSTAVLTTAVLAVAALAASIVVPSAAGARMAAPRAAHHATRRPSAHVAVIGGQPAGPGTFPWMAYVLDFRGNLRGQCSGTVVAPNLILTAGHCAENTQTGVVNEASGYRVITGNVDAAAPETERQTSEVSRVIPCPCRDRHTDVGDVALLELTTPTTAPAITLAASPPAGTAALLAGWGRTYAKQEGSVERLQWAQTVVQGQDWCERETFQFSPSSEICTIDPANHRTGACSGDSGGPLLVAEPSAVGGMVQIGVADYGFNECATTRPSVFARVDAISTWVKGWAQALASAPPAPASLPAGLVAAPTLAGIASSRSVSLRAGALSLVLTCDSEGGVCSGNAQATIKVRVEITARRDGRLIASRRIIFKEKLANVTFEIAPGASISLSSALAPQSRKLLSLLAGKPLEVMLSGRGVINRIVTLAPALRDG
jgi:secreted trypsin-like serine protease